MTTTNTTIDALRNEAACAGDLEMVAICDRALAGDDDARAECARVVAEYAAQSAPLDHPWQDILDEANAADDAAMAPWRALRAARDRHGWDSDEAREAERVAVQADRDDGYADIPPTVDLD